MKVSPQLLNFVRTATVKGLSRVGQFPTRGTDHDQLTDLLRALHPVVGDSALIRFGPRGDGGYLLPDDLEGIEACFSPGVDQIAGFELDCADRGMRVFMADRSVDQPPESHVAFEFVRRHLGATSNEDTITMDDWVSQSLPGSVADLLLQIDIEGSEYEVFMNTSDELMGRFRIIVAEFHSLEMLYSRPFFNIASRSFRKVLNTHVCVHTHPNNCCGTVKVNGLEIPRIAEFTFLRRDRVGTESFASTFPHPLDSDNTPKPTLRLPTSLYRAAGR